MPCFHPLKGYRSRTVNPSTNKRSIVFNVKEGYHDMPVDLQCGQCIGCRLERSRQWAIRCIHEASLYEDNCFITLTYNDKHLPPDGTLQVEDFQKFMKRFRKNYSDKTIRFFHCGEYGEKFSRPHYHACIFNFDFPDRELIQQRDDGNYYKSEILESIWGKGHCIVGDVTFESAAYVARYITKKITGQDAPLHYNEINFETGEILKERKPEYVTMSRRPGIGKHWIDQHQKNTYDNDRVVINGKAVRPPKYYDGQFEIAYPEELARLKAKRKQKALAHEENNTYERRLIREECQMHKFNQLKRNYENE